MTVDAPSYIGNEDPSEALLVVTLDEGLEVSLDARRRTMCFPASLIAGIAMDAHDVVDVLRVGSRTSADCM